MTTSLMQLKILLPFQVFTQQTQVTSIVVETSAGSYGLLPQRLDCVATLVAGILSYQTEANGEMYVATDCGILVKTGSIVTVSVRNAVAGTDLTQLRDIVQQQFVHLNEQEQNLRSVLAKLESRFMRKFREFQS